MTLIKRWNSEQKALLVLLAVSALLLLLGLGSRELWGPETRWANIALQMLQFVFILGVFFGGLGHAFALFADRKSTRLNSSHYQQSRMPSSA